MRTNSLSGFGTLAEWLRTKTKDRGARAELARQVGVSPQLVSSWLAGTIPSAARLQKLAAATNVDYVALRMLADGLPTTKAQDTSRFTTSTELGAYMGRKFEELNAVNHTAAMQVLGLLDALTMAQQAGDAEAAPPSSAQIAREKARKTS